MVYCGKPSKGCGACRARKVKCDQTTPSCKRCLKTNRVCPGYRDQLSLLFRDETVSVSRKAKSANDAASSSSGSSTSSVRGTPPPALNPSTQFEAFDTSSFETNFFDLNIQANDYSECSFNDEDGTSDDNSYETLSLVPLSPDRQQQSIFFCLNNFPWLNTGSDNSFLSADISPTASFADKAMMKAIMSVGMANISRIGYPSQSLQLTAQREYAEALKWTNVAISHPTQAKDDATLTAILCLSLFEILTSKKPESIDAFVKHTRGAVALLELRGESQLAATRGLQMFAFLRNEIIISCLMNYYPIPSALLTLSEKAMSVPGAPYSFVVSHRMCSFISRVNDIRIEDLQSQRSNVDASLLTRAFALDSEIEAEMNALDPEYSANIRTATPGQYFGNSDFQLFPFERQYYTYSSFYAGMIANHYRNGRILINEVILGRLQRMTTQRDFVATPEFKDLCYRLRDLVVKLAYGTFASVPYLCGFIDGPNSKGHLVSTAGGVALLFPLYVAASVDGYGSASCHWVTRCFHMIGRHMGIDQALALAEILPVEKGMYNFVNAL